MLSKSNIIKYLCTSFLILLPLLSIGQKSIIVKNVNLRAKELKQSLNTSGDSLLLDCKRQIYRVRIFNSDFSTDILVKAKFVSIPLQNLPLGRYIVLVRLRNLAIVVTLLRKEPYEGFDTIDTGETLYVKRDNIRYIEEKASIATNDSDVRNRIAYSSKKEQSKQSKPFSILEKNTVETGNVSEEASISNSDERNSNKQENITRLLLSEDEPIKNQESSNKKELTPTESKSETSKTNDILSVNEKALKSPNIEKSLISKEKSSESNESDKDTIHLDFEKRISEKLKDSTPSLSFKETKNVNQELINEKGEFVPLESRSDTSKTVDILSVNKKETKSRSQNPEKSLTSKEKINETDEVGKETMRLDSERDISEKQDNSTQQISSKETLIKNKESLNEKRFTPTENGNETSQTSDTSSRSENEEIQKQNNNEKSLTPKEKISKVDKETVLLNPKNRSSEGQKNTTQSLLSKEILPTKKQALAEKEIVSTKPETISSEMDKDTDSTGSTINSKEKLKKDSTVSTSATKNEEKQNKISDSNITRNVKENNRRARNKRLKSKNKIQRKRRRSKSKVAIQETESKRIERSRKSSRNVKKTKDKDERLVEGYWVVKTSRGHIGNKTIRHFATADRLEALITRTNRERRTFAGKHNTLTIWKIYDMTGFKRAYAKDNDYINSESSEYFNTKPYIKIPETSNSEKKKP